MAREDLDLQIVIDTIVNSKGFEEAKAGLASLTATTNSAATATKAQAAATDILTTKQKVSSREINILTRETLMAMGATQGAGAAGRVAATAFAAMGESAAFANLAMAGTGLAVVVLLPKVIEWITRTKEQSAAQKELSEELKNALPDITRYIDGVSKMSAELRALVELQQQQARSKQLKDLDDLTKRNNDLAKEVRNLSADTTEWVGDARAGYAVVRKASEENIAKAKELAKEYDENIIKINALSAAIEDGTTVEAQAAHAHDQAHKKLTDLRISQEAYTKAVKQWDFAEKSAAIARDKQKKQQEQEIDRQNKLIRLYKQEADAKREAAKKAGESAADEVKHENERAQQISDIRKQAVVTGLQAASTLFKKNKALAIAATLAETYKAATEALSSPPGPPFTIPLMAAVIAMGLANVANIQKAQAVGFDDPFSDLIASKLGRRSAADFVAHFGQGFREGMGIGHGPVSTVYNVNRGTTVNLGGVHGFIGSQTEFEKRLIRTITRAQRGETRATS